MGRGAGACFVWAISLSSASASSIFKSLDFRLGCHRIRSRGDLNPEVYIRNLSAILEASGLEDLWQKWQLIPTNLNAICHVYWTGPRY